MSLCTLSSALCFTLDSCIVLDVVSMHILFVVQAWYRDPNITDQRFSQCSDEFQVRYAAIIQHWHRYHQGVPCMTVCTAECSLTGCADMHVLRVFWVVTTSSRQLHNACPTYHFLYMLSKYGCSFQ